jgi:putative hydrolase of the HAD superfamily
MVGIPKSSGIHALLFDLGGVVVGVDFDRVFSSWAESEGCNASDLKARFAFDEAYRRHERGEISITQYCSSLRQSLGVTLSDARLVAGWTRLYVGTIPEVVRLLRIARTYLPLYAFTNSNTTHEEIWATRFAADLSLFDRVFVSCELGHRKPERAAFEAVAQISGFAPNRFLFFDDSPENVDGARAAGMHAVLVSGPADIHRALSGLGIPGLD